MRTFPSVILIVCATLAIVTGQASAVTYPFRSHQEQNIDTHQVGSIDLMIDAAGNGSLTHSWSNGQKISGNTFYSIVVLADKNGKVIYSGKQTKGIDGSYGGHAREGRVTTKFALKKEEMDRFDHVVLKMGTTNCGLKLTSFKCCDNGIEASFTTNHCDVPTTPRPRGLGLVH